MRSHIYHESKVRKGIVAGFVKKMKKGFVIIFILHIIGFTLAGVWYVGNHTIVKTDKEYASIKKESFGFERNYVDVREWTVLDYIENPEIARALIDKGYSDIQASLEKSDGKAKIDEAIQKTGEALKSITDSLTK